MVREEGLTYALGIDWARTRDTSAMVVASRDDEDRVRVAYLRGFLGIPMPDQIGFVRHLHATFAFRRIVSEYAGLGIGPTDQLVKDLGAHVVEAFRPTAESKALGYDALKSRLERGTVEIPMDPKLLAELRVLEFQITSSGVMTIHHPGGGSDDFADALMLACWPFRPRGRGHAGIALMPWGADAVVRSALSALAPSRALQGQGPRVLGTCERCRGPITTGQEFVGLNPTLHAKCPSLAGE
jgi:hypothetical protein